MTTLGTRDRYLLGLLLPLALVALHVFWLRPGLDERREKTQIAIRRSPAPGRIEAAEQEVRRLGAVADTDEEIAGRVEEEERAFLRRWSDPTRRAATTVALSGLFAECGLEVRRSEIEAQPSAALSPALCELERRIVRLGGARPEVWCCRAVGSWKSVLDLLDAVGSFESFAEPVAVSLRSIPGAVDLEVQVWIWI